MISTSKLANWWKRTKLSSKSNSMQFLRLWIWLLIYYIHTAISKVSTKVRKHSLTLLIRQKSRCTRAEGFDQHFPHHFQRSDRAPESVWSQIKELENDLSLLNYFTLKIIHKDILKYRWSRHQGIFHISKVLVQRYSVVFLLFDLSIQLLIFLFSFQLIWD